jgi:hypothetical protein
MPGRLKSPRSKIVRPPSPPAQEPIVAVPNPADAQVLEDFRMYAVLGTWMESDIVAANIRNAIIQGCDRVYLVDNDSSDDTVEIARREGAILARTFHSEQNDEALRLQYMNDVVREVSESDGTRHIWWLFLDADEFSHGPSGMTLHQYLSTLDMRFRVVGVRYFNHYPDRLPHYVPGRHPLDFQPLCEEIPLPMCPSGHRKHPLLRFDAEGPPIISGPGFHVPSSPSPLYEPSQPAFLHHFPFRDEELTRRKLELLCAPGGVAGPRALESRGDTHMAARFRSLDAVYARDWSRVENFVAIDPICEWLDIAPPRFGVRLRRWSEAVEPEHRHVLRWHPMTGAWHDGVRGHARLHPPGAYTPRVSVSKSPGR